MPDRRRRQLRRWAYLQPSIASPRVNCYRWLQISGRARSVPPRGDPPRGDGHRRRQAKEEILMPGLVIDREVVIEAPVEVVWRTITEPDQLSQWFADRVDLVVEPGAHG